MSVFLKPVSPYTQGHGILPWVPMLLALLLTPLAHGAAHDQWPGSNLPVHYVELRGHGGDNDVNRENMLAAYHGCVSIQTAFSRPYQPLPTSGIPPVVIDITIEIYYAANRTLTIQHGTLYDINPLTCAVEAIPHHTSTLDSSIGYCRIDWLTKTAIEMCDTKAHERAPLRLPPPPAEVTVPIVDMNKVPPAMRAQLEAHLNRLRQVLPATAPGGSDLKREIRLIADTNCQRYVHRVARTEFCMATSPPSVDQALRPSSYSPAPLGGGHLGVLMELKSPALTLKALQVQWSMTVSAEMFQLPPGVKVRSATGAQ